MIIAIDGPAGAGKSTVTRLLAERLGFQFLDTGAMYRAVTWCALERGVDLGDEAALADLAQRLTVTFESEQVFVDGQDVTTAIREPRVTRNVGSIADAVEVRHHLVRLQREIASRGDFVCEGRDQGTVAFPDAFCKIYLTASESDRAQRRMEQLGLADEPLNFEQILEEQRLRDQQDLSRKVGRLQQAEDAVVVNTDGKSLDEVVGELLAIVAQARRRKASRI